MEVHPILEEFVSPADKLWYVVSALGDRPSLRVGHTANFVPSRDENVNGKVVFIGGANPSESFSDIHVLDLETLSWNVTSPPGFTARYEHASFIPASQPDHVYVIVGATQEGNVVDVQKYGVLADNWDKVKTTGPAISPRTHHSSVSIGDCIYFYSGGKSGPDPVQDRQVHCFNAATDTWSALSVTGEGPAPRHGHTLCAIGDKLVCFGGMAGPKLYNDIYILDLEKASWQCPKIKKATPSPRAAHSAVVYGKVMYVFGGLTKEGVASDELWKFDISIMQWTLCSLEGPPPPSRLDMASCVIAWSAQPEPGEPLSERLEAISIDASVGGDAAKPAVAREDETTVQRREAPVQLFLIHGGMDTQGEIFDDCLVYKLC